MGQLFEKDHDNENALKMYLRAVELNKQSPIAHYRTGMIYIKNGDKGRGIEHLKKALSFDPNNVDVLAKLGEVLMKDPNTFDESEQYFKKALYNDENNSDSLVGMGRIFEKRNRLEQAIACFEKAIKQPVTNVNAYYHLGVIHEKQKDYKKAIQLFKQCLIVDQVHFAACIHLATL